MALPLSRASMARWPQRRAAVAGSGPRSPPWARIPPSRRAAPAPGLRKPRGGAVGRPGRPAAAGGDGSSPIRAELLVLVEQSQRTMRDLYVRALPGPLAWCPSFLVPLAAAASVAGAAHGHRLLHLLAALQAPDWLPMAHTLGGVYAARPGLCDAALDALLSTACALLLFVGAPALDLLLGSDPKTPAQAEGPDGVYRALLHAHVLLHWLLLAAAFSAAGSGEVHPLALLGLTASLGCEGALIFTVAHELLHSPCARDRRAASLGLAPLGYMHWVPSHRAHHRQMGLREDPATARLGESLYAFVGRSVAGNLRDGVRAELRRLRARRLPLLSAHNRLFRWAVCPLGLLAGVWQLWGPAAAALGVAQAALSIFFLEDVNYIEHYGLRRQRLGSGRPEPVAVSHSWNANWLFTNSLIFSLQRHSDHHAHAHKPYQLLEDVAEAPQLPASYPAMVLLALLPGLFFDVMDPRALQVAHAQARRRS